MTHLVALVGSLRKKSYNLFLAQAATELAPKGTTVEVATVVGIPLYNADEEKAHGVPVQVTELKRRVKDCAGLLLVSPEYNNGIPGVMKNAIDWMSRPPSDIQTVFGAKPVALMGATPGGGGTRLAQTAWLPVLRTLGMRPWFDIPLYVTGASKVFSNDEKLTDDAIRERLSNLLAGFVEYVGP